MHRPRLLFQRLIRCIVPLLFCLLAFPHSLVGNEFHVSPTGVDSNPGTKGKPFQSLERARDAVREIRKGSKRSTPSTVWLHPGIHFRSTTLRLGAIDSGTAKAPIVYRGVPGADVRISGGLHLPVSKFGPVKDSEVQRRLADGAAVPGQRKKHVFCGLGLC